MSAVRQIPLADFARNHQPMRVRPSSRAAASMLTCCVYALFGLLLLEKTRPVQSALPTFEATALILADTPHKKQPPLPPPFLAHWIRPHPETVALPTFTIASTAPAAPALLPASAAKTSPIPGGVPAGTGTKGAGISANGSCGNGDVAAGCFDAAWARAVSDHVGRYFYYPNAAHWGHITGVVMMDFVVRNDGRVEKLEIGKSSGASSLDAAAYNIVHKAEPLPAFSERMHLNRIEVELPIGFGRIDPNLKPSAGTCS